MDAPGRRGVRIDRIDRREMQHAVLDAVDVDDAGAAEAGGALGDSLQDALEIGRRRRDDPQDLGGDGLLLQRLGQLAVALLQLLRTAGRSRWRWPPDRRTSPAARSARPVNGRTSMRGDGDRADRLALAQQRSRRGWCGGRSDRWSSRPSGNSSVGTARRGPDVDGTPVDHGPSARHGPRLIGGRLRPRSMIDRPARCAVRPSREQSPSRRDGCGRCRRRRGGRRSRRSSRGPPCEVRRRGRDDAQDLSRGGLLLQRLGQVAVALLQLRNRRAFSMAMAA